MMNMGMMPRGQGSRRVITRQLCLKNHAMDEPNWLDGNQTSVAFLDAAYGGVGGDRCIFGVLKFGSEAEPIDPGELLYNIVNQKPHDQRIAPRKNTRVNKQENQRKEKGKKQRNLGAHHQLDRHERNANGGKHVNLN